MRLLLKLNFSFRRHGSVCVKNNYKIIIENVYLFKQTKGMFPSTYLVTFNQLKHLPSLKHSHPLILIYECLT